MDTQRAQEILTAPHLVDVVYNGSQIFIQKVNEQTRTANIYHLANPDNKEEVALDHLMEQ